MALDFNIRLADIPGFAEKVADLVAEKLRPGTATTAPDYFTVEQAAAALGWTPRAVRDAIKGGPLKATRPGGGRRLSIARADLEAFQRGGGGAGAPDLAAEARRMLAKGRQR